MNNDGSKLSMASLAGFELEVARNMGSMATSTTAASTPGSRKSSSFVSAAVVTPRTAGRRYAGGKNWTGNAELIFHVTVYPHLEYDPTLKIAVWMQNCYIPLNRWIP